MPVTLKLVPAALPPVIATAPVVRSTGVPSPQLILTAKSLTVATGLTSVKVATVAPERDVPSTPVSGLPVAAIRGASAMAAVAGMITLAPPTSPPLSSTMTVKVKAPASTYLCEPTTANPAPAAITLADPFVPSPQSTVALKSVASPKGLPSVKVASVTIDPPAAFAKAIPSTPTRPTAGPAVRGASRTRTLATMLVDLPPMSLTVIWTDEGPTLR